MKNLKKILSLTLAVVMLFGMMIFPVSAADDETDVRMTYADLVDKDEIENLTEVALLVDLGIIEGRPGNVYDPTGIVDRATMAKLVTLLLIRDADQSIFEGTITALTDVADTHWAKGWISYAYSQGIIAGDGLGSFRPGDTISVAEAAKMLLVTLGYDAEKAGLVGADWLINSMTIAKSVGMLNGLGGINGSTKLDRDTMAQMIYNTLFAKQVTYSSIFSANTPIVLNNSLGLSTYGLLKVTGVVNEADGKGFKLATGSVTTEPDVSSVFSGNVEGIKFELPNQEAFVGKSVTFFYEVETKVSTGNNGLNLAASLEPKAAKVVRIYSSELVLNTNNVLATIYDGTAYGKLVDSDEDKFVAEKDDTVSFYLNGSASTETKATAAIQKGGVVNLLDNDGNGKIDVVEVLKYTYAKVTAKSTSGDGSMVFSFAFANNDGDSVSATSKNTPAFADFAKDDYVYGYVDGNDKIQLFAPELIEGKVNSKTSKDFKLDGTTYSFAAGAISVLGDISVGDDHEVYMTTSGYAMVAKAASSTKNYGMLMATSGTSNVNNATARILFVDGTSGLITINSWEDVDGDDVDRNGEDSNGYNDKNMTQIVTYTERDDGTYNLVDVAGTPLKDAIIKNKATRIYDENEDPMTTTGTVNAKTEFIVEKTNTVYTGYDEVPGMTDVNGAVYVDNGVAKYVFISDSHSSASADDKFTIYNTTKWEEFGSGANKFYTFEAIVKGAIDEVNVSPTIKNKIIEEGVGIYLADTTTTMDGNKVIDKLDTTNGYTPFSVAVVAQAGSGVVQVEGGDPYKVTDATKFIRFEADGVQFKVNEAGEGNVINNDLQKSKLEIIANDKDEAEYVYIFPTVTYTVTASTASVTLNGASDSKTVTITVNQFNGTYKNGETVTATSNNDRITVTPASGETTGVGQITLTITSDSVAAAYDGKITVTCNGVTCQIEVDVTAS